MKLRFIIVLSCFIAQTYAQQIIVDGDFQDWDNSSPTLNDAGDSQGLDIESVQVSYDDIYLFLKVELNQEILLQQNNNILLGVDFDNNTNSGFDLGAIGAELVFNCGQRNGILSAGQAILQVQHEDIGLISSPTVSSNEFEIAIHRRFTVSGQSFEMGDIVSVHISGELEQGDQLPNFGRFEIPLSDSRPQQNQEYTLSESALSDFRFMSFNVLRDNIFEFGVRSAFASLMKAVNADVYCFQEVYDHDDDELLDLMISLDVLDQSQSWYSVKHDPDLITISRYPIVYEQNVGNNSASVLDVDGTELLIVNMHLPCCENDFGREVEIDQVLRFVRRSKDGQLPYQLQDNTPYIFCGDLNLVGHASQLESLINGNINDNSFFGPDVTLDWDDDHMTDLKAPTTGYPAVFTWYSPFSSFFPGRLDFVIYTDSRLEALNRFVLNSQGLNQAEQSAFQINDNSSLITSDHMPVVADFRIKSLDSVADTSYEFEVYPNPAQSILYLRNQIEEIESLIFYDLGGRLLKTIRNPGNRIQLDFEPGLYFMQIHSNSGQSSTRSIVIK